MLNQSIRRIRTDEQNHQQRMMGLQIENEKLDAQLNDPRTKLAKVQAARQLETVPIKFKIGEFDNDQDRQIFNKYSRPAIEKVLQDEGMALGEDGQITDAGSTKVATRPRYVSQALSNKLALANMASRLGHNELEMEIDTLTQDIYDTKRKQGPISSHPKDKILRLGLRQKEEKLAKLVAKRDDPNEQVSRLVETNSRLTDMQLAAMSDPNIGSEVFERINDIQKVTNNQIKTLLSKGADAKNIKAVTYTYQDDETGELIEQTKYMSWADANNAPESYEADGKTYVKGKISSAPKGSGTSDRLSEMTPAKWDTVNKNYTKARAVLGVAKHKDKGRAFMVDILIDGGGMEREEAEAMVSRIKQDVTGFIQEQKNLIATYDLQYGSSKYYQPNVAKSKSPKTKSGATSTSVSSIGDELKKIAGY